MDAKHAKPEEIKLVANVPEDAYYKELINALERKLGDYQTKYEMALNYIEHLEGEKIELTDRVEKLEKAVIDAAIR